MENTFTPPHKGPLLLSLINSFNLDTQDSKAEMLSFFKRLDLNSLLQEVVQLSFCS